MSRSFAPWGGGLSYLVPAKQAAQRRGGCGEGGLHRGTILFGEGGAPADQSPPGCLTPAGMAGGPPRRAAGHGAGPPPRPARRSRTSTAPLRYGRSVPPSCDVLGPCCTVPCRVVLGCGVVFFWFKLWMGTTTKICSGDRLLMGVSVRFFEGGILKLDACR